MAQPAASFVLLAGRTRIGLRRNPAAPPPRGVIGSLIPRGDRTHEPPREDCRRCRGRHFPGRMASTHRPRRGLPADRALRLGRCHLQSFLHARARRGTKIPHQAPRAPLHRSDAGQSRQGEHGRRPRRIRGRQPAGLHLAWRRAVGASGRELRRPRPHRDRHGDRRIAGRIAHGVAGRDPLLQSRRLPRLRRHHRGFRRARASPRHSAPTERSCCTTTGCSRSARPRAKPSS